MTRDTLSIQDVVQYFEATTGYRLKDVVRRPDSPRRSGRSLETARRVLIGMLAKLTWASVAEIQEVLGYQHHTSIIHAKKRAETEPLVVKATRKRVREVISG